MSDQKPGYQTTEFYVTLFTSLAAVAALFTNKIHLGADAIQTLAGVAALIVPSIVYVFSRTKVKTS